MTEESVITSKALVYEADESALEFLKEFFLKNNIQGIRERKNEINKVLDVNIDLGAVFLSESKDEFGYSGFDICKKIHEVRPELPIVIRRLEEHKNEPLPEEINQAVVAQYTIDDLESLKEFLQVNLFNRHYPAPLVHEVLEITSNALQFNIKNISVENSAPYLVKDMLIFGEVFSLIPLESSWCRGYMTIQSPSNDFEKYIESDRTHIPRNEYSGSRGVNFLLNEITNLVWGGIKSKFFTETDDQASIGSAIQVPIMVNHVHKFISFGSQEPQLTFSYVIKDELGILPDFKILQKLIFNLTWSPDLMKISDQIISDSLDSGELEFFD